MSYSNKILIKELEPIYDNSGTRTEWRFEENKIYSTNVLLANITAQQNTASKYNRLMGASGMFDNVQLFDGNVELQATQLAAFWCGWNQSRKSNSSLKDLQSMLIGNARGTIFEGYDTTANGSAGRTHGKNLRPFVSAGGGNIILSKTGRASIYANEFLPILNALPYLDTSIFKNLRLVVEYSMSGGSIVRENQGEILTTDRPLLVVEEVVDPTQVAAVMGKMGNIAFDNVETDRNLVAGLTTITSETLQQTNFHVNSFNNKKVGKILIWKQSQLGSNGGDGGADYQNGTYDSVGLFKEGTQIRVNGQNIFAKNGINKPNKRLARLNDSWGSGGLQTFANGLAYIAPENEPRNRYLAGGNSSVGYMDWFGCDLGYQEVQDFQVEFSRTGVACIGAGNTNDTAQTALSKYNQPYKLIMFALTQKAIVMDGKGSYDVKYL
jgi:hypothetical protein